MKKNLIVSILMILGLYIFATGISFAIFTFVIPSSLNIVSGQNNQDKNDTEAKEDSNSQLKKLLDNSGPKTAVCPLNGALFTEAEKKSWETRRPLLVMIENHEEARPQSGLSSADIVYETVAEGGITRFMGVYYCDAQAYEVIVGPVRSARTYYLDWASEYGANPLYTHVGGANCNHGCPSGYSKADALGQIDKYGWGGYEGNDLSQFSIGYPTFWRDYERLGHTVATEHTMYSTTERLWAIAKQRQWTNVDSEGVTWDEDYVSWKFLEKIPDQKGTTIDIAYDFWEDSPAGDYSTGWKYDPATNSYARTQSGQPHTDLNTKQQLAVKNVVVMYAVESSANDGYPNNAHLLYGTIGKGKAVLFQNGEATKVNWSKTTRTDRTTFTDAVSGKEINFVPGKIWISILDVSNETLKY